MLDVFFSSGKSPCKTIYDAEDSFPTGAIRKTGRVFLRPDIINIQALDGVIFNVKYLIIVRNTTVHWDQYDIDHLKFTVIKSLLSVGWSTKKYNRCRTQPCRRWEETSFRMLKWSYEQWSTPWPIWKLLWKGFTFKKYYLTHSLISSAWFL